MCWLFSGWTVSSKSKARGQWDGMGSREGRASLSACKVKTSPRGGGGPSTFEEVEAGSMSKLHANDRMAAVARSAVQREVQARAAAWRREGGFEEALCLAKSRTKVTASALQRPPVSIPSTTSLARPDPVNSGYVRDFAWRASRKAAPAVWRWCLRGWPAAVKGETNVVSTASCEPFHKGRPLAMTSMRLSSCWAVSR